MGTIRDEILQTRPFASAAEEAVVTLVATAGRVRDGLSRVVEQSGITLQQYNVLRILRGGGKDGVPTLEVAERMVEQTPGITRLLDRLEAKGFVTRQRCPKDRRQHLCWITPKSTALLEKLDGPMVQFGEQLMKGLKHEDRVALIRLLDALRAAHE
jgi:DNA-binding MarR family transcriptional regulator